MTCSTRKFKSDKTGKEFVNFLINSLPLEAHFSDYEILVKIKKETRLQWYRIITKDTPRKKKFVTYAVKNAVKTKRKIGMGCKGKRKHATRKMVH